MGNANGIATNVEASTSATSEAAEETIDPDLSCLICHEDFDLKDHLPKMLDCHHTMCIGCLKVYPVGEVIKCPYKCERGTNLNGQTADQLTTNFYLLPKVEKIAEHRKKIDYLFSKTQNNCAEAIALRRDTFAPRLKEVQKAFQFLTGVIATSTEDNNEQTAVLQSKLEHSIDERRENLPLNLLEEEHKKSEEVLKAAQMLAESLTDLEQFTCSINLTNTIDGTTYLMKSLDDCLVFINSSTHGPKISAAALALNYILAQFKSANLWEKIEQVDNQQVTTQQAEEDTESAEDVAKVEEGAVAVLNDNNNFEEFGNKEIVHRSLSSSATRHQDMVYLQFSVCGKTYPPVVIKLNHKKAPIMCKHFLEYIHGTNDLTYQATPLMKSERNKYLTFGEFSRLQKVNGQYSNTMQEPDARFLVDHSNMKERRGAVRLRLRDRHVQGVLCSSEFSILLVETKSPFPLTTCFGYVLEGLDICDQISKLETVPYNSVRIQNCGNWNNHHSSSTQHP